MTLKNLAIFAAVAIVLYMLYKRSNATTVQTTGSPWIGTAPLPVITDADGNQVIAYSFN